MGTSTVQFTPLNLKECMETIRAKVAEMKKDAPKSTDSVEFKPLKANDIWSRIED